MKSKLKKIKNPLRKRWYREILQEKGKYFALFLFIFLTVGFISGFLVADNSLKKAYDESFQKYNTEHGHFSLAVEADKEVVKKAEKEHVKIERQFYKEEEIEHFGKTSNKEHAVRVFETRKTINKACLMKGVLPKKRNEIALDRLYAENNQLQLGDFVRIAKKSYKIVGFVALPDYSCLFKKNSDMMFDATKFTVGLVTKRGFQDIPKENLFYQYAWRDKKGVNYDNLKKQLSKTGILTEYLERNENNAITFTGDDMGSDKKMMITLLYLVVAVLGFVFGITIRGMIENESVQIGVLRAGGFSAGTLLVQYAKLPVMLVLVSSALGNLLGYTYMKHVVANLYYKSYSLTAYKTIWSPEAFLLTTLIPAVIIFVIVFAMLFRMLSMEPLRLLHKDFRHNTGRGLVNMPNRKFLTRFRYRVIACNKGAYLILFVGICFAGLIMMFGLVLQPIMNHFRSEVLDSSIAKHQYILKIPTGTAVRGAEKYSVSKLEIKGKDEAVVYGVNRNSSYLKDLNFSSGEKDVLISDGYAEKYKLKKGSKITLKDKNSDKKYTLNVSGVKRYAANLAVFMPRHRYNKIFEKNSGYYNGYFSDRKINDIDEKFIETDLTFKDFTVIADQLEDSMAGIFPMITAFAVVLYILLMYLLSKFVIEKNHKAISLLRILGYTGKEVGRIYNYATAVAVLISLAVSVPIIRIVMRLLYYSFMSKINGWLPYYVAPFINVAIIIVGGLCYMIVHIYNMRKVQKTKMSDLIKSVE